jgi:cyclohexanecarboxyl-CoA dehydrogenase
MDLALSDEQRAFAEAVGAFARRHVAPHAADADRRGAFAPGLLTEFAALGLTGLRIAPEHGGQGADAVTTGIACEQIAAADLSAGYLVLVPMLVAEVLAAAAPAARQAEWLPDIAAGRVLPCFCLTEPGHGSDAAGLTLRARRDGAGWRLTGEKTSISLGARADAALVFARTGGDGARGVSAFYTELDDRHVQRSAFEDLGSRAVGRATLSFDGHPAALVGAEGAGFRDCMRGFDFSRALIGLMCLASARQGLEEAIAHARERRAFGGPISRHQGVAFPLVEGATRLRGARWLCLEALWRRDRGLPHAAEANMAKWWAPQLAVEVAHQALLTLGHPGYSEELPAARRLRDLIGFELGDGTAQIAKLVVARELLGRDAAP